ncbi:hypothetical protein D3C75_1222560 [compost metagenome]
MNAFVLDSDIAWVIVGNVFPYQGAKKVRLSKDLIAKMENIRCFRVIDGDGDHARRSQ